MSFIHSDNESFVFKGKDANGTDQIHYLAPFDGVELLLQAFLHTGLLFVRNEDEAPPLLCFSVDGQLDGVDLLGKRQRQVGGEKGENKVVTTPQQRRRITFFWGG